MRQDETRWEEMRGDERKRCKVGRNVFLNRTI